MIPADDAVPGQPVAALGDLPLFLHGLSDRGDFRRRRRARQASRSAASANPGIRGIHGKIGNKAGRDRVGEIAARVRFAARWVFRSSLRRIPGCDRFETAEPEAQNPISRFVLLCRYAQQCNPIFAPPPGIPAMESANGGSGLQPGRVRIVCPAYSLYAACRTDISQDSSDSAEHLARWYAISAFQNFVTRKRLSGRTKLNQESLLG